jgi:hypothetical protein
MRRHSDWLALADGFLRIGLALPSDFATMAMTDALRDRDPAAIAAFRARPGFAAWSQRHGNAAVAGVAAGAGDIVAATLASLGAAA